MYRISRLLVVLLVVGLLPYAVAERPALALNNGAALTPPMGWNAWNTFRCNVNETLIKAVADAVVNNGMKAVGYQYINLDDCWMGGRDSSGRLFAHPTRFPSGMQALSDYIHARGLKFGIYQAANTQTCAYFYDGEPANRAVGSLGYEVQDAATFASWGVDYLKYDLCRGNRASFATMRDALARTGRKIAYSINPEQLPTTPGWDVVNIANSLRISSDIAMSWSSITSIIDRNAGLASYAGPDHWNDMDMLQAGRGLPVNEDQVHFGMWAIMASPLITGNDLRTVSATTLSILKNTEVIAVNQDSLGAQGRRVRDNGDQEVWSKPLKDGSRAVALLNRGSAAANITVNWSDIGISGDARVRNLWQYADKGTFSGSYTTNVSSHSVVMLKISGTPLPSGSLIPRTNWKVKYVDSQETSSENGAATNAIDGNLSTHWHTRWSGTTDPLPHEIQIDMSASYSVNGFRYLPRQDSYTNGRIGQYEFYVSADGTNWGTPVAAGTFVNDASEKQVNFTAKSGRYLRLRALSEVGGNQWTSAAELNALSSAVVTPTPLTRTPTPTIITPTPTSVPTTVFVDDFETNKGWMVNSNGTDTATLGQWERGDPEATDYDGPKQLDTTASGLNDLVTGRLAGSGPGAYDLDGGVTSIRSPSITLPSSGNLTLSFRYYLAHATNAGSDDYFRLRVVGSTTTTMFEKLGAAADIDAAWQTATVNLSGYGGQSIRIQFEAADVGTGGLLEAAVDDVSITMR